MGGDWDLGSEEGSREAADGWIGDRLFSSGANQKRRSGQCGGSSVSGYRTPEPPTAGCSALQPLSSPPSTRCKIRRSISPLDSGMQLREVSL